MKKDKDKYKKGKESTIGKIIYGFLLFLPLLIIGTTCLYTIFNKNAKDSFSASTYTAEKSIDIDLPETINTYANFTGEKGTYLFSTSTRYPKVQYRSTGFVIKNISIYGTDNLTDYSIYKYIAGSSTGYTGQYTIYLTEEEPTISNGGIVSVTGNYTTLTNTDAFFVNLTNETQIKKGLYVTGTQIKNILAYKPIYPTLNNTFYIAIDKLQESNLFNWTTNSVIYTGMAEFTTSLSITNTFIPQLLTYWLIISLVYFIYDIILIIFNVLHRKIHELQDSI